MYTLKNVKVLIAEDDYLVCEEILRILRNIGYDIIGTACNGEEAVEMTCSLKPDVVIMDIKMPKLDGLEASQQIQNNCLTPIVILTAHDSKDLINEASEKGVSAYLIKPPKAVEVEKAIIIAMARHDDLMKANRLNKELQEEIVKRKQIEKLLKESEAKYRLMIENSKDAIVINQNGRIVFFNNSLFRMLDYKTKNEMPLYCKDIHTNEIFCEFERDKNQSNIENRYETMLKKKDGEKLYVEINSTHIDYDGEEATFSIIRDITRQKEIYDNLKETVKQGKGLEEMIPICAGCHKIRDDEKEGSPWLQLFEYISERLPNVQFSHGMCPDCIKKWYPDYKVEDNKQHLDE